MIIGIIAARNDTIGIVGVAPGAQLYAVKVLDAYGSGSISDVIEGIDWAIQNNMAPVWSADGTKIELSAPGVNIYSTWLNGGYINASGTSMAAPFVSSVAALIKSKNISMTLQEIREAMAYNAIDLGEAGRDRRYGLDWCRQVDIEDNNYL